MLKQLETLIASDILANTTTELAHYVLAGASHLEKRGSFVNGKGRVQKFMQAIEAPGDARADWEWLREWVVTLTAQAIPDTLPGIFNALSQQTEAFGGVTWKDIGDQGADIKI